MTNIVEQVDRMSIYVQPVHFVLVLVTNTLNICVLRCRILRSSPCAHFFLVYAISSIIYTCILCPIQILRSYAIFWINTPAGCKIQPYVLFVIPLQANLMLVLASFNRVCSSSIQPRFRAMSNIRTTRLSTVFGTILCMVYMWPMLIIYYWDASLGICLQYSNMIVKIYIVSQIVLYYIVAPSLMILFGFLTISNIRERMLHQAFIKIVRRSCRTERQLTRMLLLQVGAHLIFSFPFGIFYLLNSFVPSTRTPFVLALRLICVAWQQCNYFVSFFLYTLSARVYRSRLVRILKLTDFRRKMAQHHKRKQARVSFRHPVITTNRVKTKSIDETWV